MYCMHIYCGDGKGKTTAALGLALRAAGAGKKVFIAQLMKGRYTSELASLKLIPLITVKRCDRDYGFVKTMSGTDRSEITECHNRLLENAFSSGAEVIILDEFNSAYTHGLMDKGRARELIFGNIGKCEIILTGRSPAEEFLNAADYVSETACIKHPFGKGVSAREGIEF